jgi:hypothetical protein
MEKPKVNHTVVAIVAIIAITIIIGLALTRPVVAPVTSVDQDSTLTPSDNIETETNAGLEGPTEPAPLPPAPEPEDIPELIVPPTDEPEVVACTMDAKQGPDGIYVGRVAPDCNFAPCPPVETLEPPEQVFCTQDVKECPDGSYVGREAPDCEFAACPTPPPIMQLQSGQ